MFARISLYHVRDELRSKRLKGDAVYQREQGGPPPPLLAASLNVLSKNQASTAYLR